MADTLNLRTPTGYDGAKATVYKMGIVRLATDAEAITGTDSQKVITPASLAAVLGGGISPVFGTITATLIHGTTIDTNVPAAQLVLNGTGITATGTDANVSMNLDTKGTGSLVFSRSAAGVDLNMQITNSDNTAVASSAGLQIAVGGSTSTGDPYLSFQISGVGAATMTMGLDNSASDMFVISNSTALGTSNALTLSQAGALTATTTITAGTGITATTGNIVASTGNITSTLAAVSAATTVTAGTGITATTGNIVASSGFISASTTITAGTNLVATAGSVSAGTSVTAGTTVTATLGAITATDGNLVLGTAGNKIMSTSVASTTTAGANSFGTVTLVGGTATISTSSVNAASIIMLTRMSVGATGANDLGILSIGTIVAATSFVINAWTVTDATALQGDDVSVIGWMIIN